jgi:6-pyruvoyltetrahydropterin/6-carboxytetrahydropterin synthase
MYEITVIVDFEAAHRIVDYPGKCNRLHGHNWSVEVTVAGKRLNELGMLIDFRELKNEVNQVIGRLDHIYLNELEPFCTQNPTAENIARYIFSELKLKPAFQGEIFIRAVKVWESPKSAVTYSEDI